MKNINYESSNNDQLGNVKRFKFLFIIDTLYGFAGTEKHLFQLITYLIKKKYICRVIAFNATPFMIQKFRENGVIIYSLQIDKIYTKRAILKFRILLNFIRSFKPEIVQTFHFRSDTFGVLAAKLANVPVIISSRRDMGDLKNRRQIFINRICNPMITHFISVCDRVKLNLAKIEHIPIKKITTIYNGVELKYYHAGLSDKNGLRAKFGIDKSAFIIGTACLFRPEKDVLLLLKSISRIKYTINNFNILLVGTGETENDLVSYCKHNGLYEYTIFTGYVDDIRDYIQMMDVVCLTPNKNEGFSNVILEEMAIAKPIIATDVGGNAELILDGITGYIIPPGDSDFLSKRILELYRNPTLRKRMGVSSRKRVEELFSLEKMYHNMSNFYHGLLEKTS